VVGDWERDVISGAADGADYLSVVVPVKLAIDRWYVRSASPWVDALVVWTLARRLSGRSEPRHLRNRITAAVPSASAAAGWSSVRG
jgi:hypothetical protein